ncbi:MAG: polyprenyl synthetase family protein [Pseudomonadota bacterium]
MLDTQRHSPVCVNDVDAEIEQLIACGPNQVANAARYHFAAGGSRVRAQLGLDAAAALDLSRQACVSCALAPELLHNASLIHDDFQDGDRVRRGRPAVWSKYGKDTAILTGDFLISMAYATIAHHRQPALALRLIHETVMTTIAGQTDDLSATQPAPEDYEDIAANKSGPLLALPVQLALVAADMGGQGVARRVGRALSVAYQIFDDICDRNADLVHGATNICLILEANGQSRASAKVVARTMAQASLSAARRDANSLPQGTGTPFLSLANHFETKLEDLLDAT